MSIEPRDDQVAEGRLPDVAVALVEEVARLFALDVVQERELGIAIRRGPCKGNRPPDAEVMTQMRVIDRDGVVQLREHPQKPGAAAARRAEDPDEVILAASETEAVFPRWLV